LTSHPEKKALANRTQRKEENCGEMAELISSFLRRAGHRNFSLESSPCFGTATKNRKALLFVGRIGENLFAWVLNEMFCRKGELA
jgi:hypothetical protein